MLQITEDDDVFTLQHSQMFGLQNFLAQINSLAQGHWTFKAHLCGQKQLTSALRHGQVRINQPRVYKTMQTGQRETFFKVIFVGWE